MNNKSLYVRIVGLAVSSFGNYSLAIGMEIKRPSLMAAAKLGNIRLFHKDNKFVVERDGKEKNIQPCFVSPTLRNANSDLLSKFLVADGYLRLNELKDANGSIDYKLDACGRLNGGGPTGALAAYTGTRIVGYISLAAIWVSVPITGGATAPLAAKATLFAAEGGIEATAAAVGTAVLMLPTP